MPKVKKIFGCSAKFYFLCLCYAHYKNYTNHYHFAPTFYIHVKEDLCNEFKFMLIFTGKTKRD